MIKAKEGKKVVASYKNLQEACIAMVDAKKAANAKAAKFNISAALRGNEGRQIRTTHHPISGQPRYTAYGYSWNETKR